MVTMSANSENINCSGHHQQMLQSKSRRLLWRPATLGPATAFTIICIFLLASLASITTLVEAKNQKDGKFAKTLDEYHSTIKCMLNIAEETLPGMSCNNWIYNWTNCYRYRQPQTEMSCLIIVFVFRTERLYDMLWLLGYARFYHSQGGRRMRTGKPATGEALDGSYGATYSWPVYWLWAWFLHLSHVGHHANNICHSFCGINSWHLRMLVCIILQVDCSAQKVFACGKSQHCQSDDQKQSEQG